MTTPYHAKYFAHELTRQGGEGVDRLSRSLFDACVDLNPHQIDAALFALRSPISKGVLLADEVGLGKTIEAGLVACQSWAERKRRILVISPASLRKQWEQELAEKFNLPVRVLDSKIYREIKSSGNPMPFIGNSIMICSMHFASAKADDIRAIPWDLVIIDEAHKLRNSYRQSNRLGQNIRWALEDRKKILLTATPLQNSLLELYGLASLIDERIFGDPSTFRTQYAGVGGQMEELKERLQNFCNRTLRRQVLEYIRYTERKLITIPFEPSERELNLYHSISNYLQREENYALPKQQRHLITLLVRKVLASSPHAVAGTLIMMKNRLERMREAYKDTLTAVEKLIQGEEIDDDLLDEILEDEEDIAIELANGNGKADESENDEPVSLEIDLDRLNEEIAELERFIQWSESIGVDTKTRALLKALDTGFDKMAEMGANPKAVVFTESRRTQMFLKDFLEANGYAGKVVTYNGVNRDPDSTAIYQNWIEQNKLTGRSTGSRAIDARTALIESFRDDAPILIATEAGAEGINLQFCSLVINYDLPWNPQRIEQRIGRCHRYGQQHDVVVINFLNQRNAADQRVYELLEHKFNLFSGVFGASDEVLGSLESGVDFERRIFDIYQQCRSPEEIQSAFQQLQEELNETIQQRIEDTRKILLEHFDEDVHNRLKDNLSDTKVKLDEISRMFWTLSKFILKDRAEFNDEAYTFKLKQAPIEEVEEGEYHLISKDQKSTPSDFLYRLSHPLGEHVIETGKSLEAPQARVLFDISNHPLKISVVSQMKGRKGHLLLQRLCIDSFEREEYLVFSAIDENGKSLDPEIFPKFFHCDAEASYDGTVSEDTLNRLEKEADQGIRQTINRSLEANHKHFNEARDQLEKWADDMVLRAEKELNDVKNQIKTLNREARQALTLDEQSKIQNQITQLERKKRKLRQNIFNIEDEIAEKRDTLIDSLEQRMKQKTKVEPLFMIQWEVV